MLDLVSIIIPVYNGDRYLARTLESIFSQTYSRYEIIVVDDGSTDNTRQCLQPYRDRIRYVYQENQGVAAARNQGMRLAQGEFVAFLDQDDVMLPDKLALQVSSFVNNPGAGMVHSGWKLVDGAENPLSDVEPWHDAPVLDAEGWLRRMPVLLSAMLFRHTWLERAGKFDSHYLQACDVDLVQRLVLLGCPTVWVRRITVLYRQHDRNDSLNTLVQAEEAWKVRRHFFDRPDLPDGLRACEQESCYSVLVWIAWRLFHTQRFPEMALYLEKALEYRPGTWTEAVIRWIELFQQYETEYGCQFEMSKLTQSPEWRNLMQRQMRQSQLIGANVTFSSSRNADR
jgi:glycosyltransferase involved in cell wall biosynthesis